MSIVAYLIALRQKINKKFEKKKTKKQQNGNRTNIRNLFFVKGKKTPQALNIYRILWLLQ